MVQVEQVVVLILEMVMLEQPVLEEVVEVVKIVPVAVVLVE